MCKENLKPETVNVIQEALEGSVILSDPLTPFHRGLFGVPRLPTFWPIAGLGKLGRESFRARSKRLAETLPTILYTS